MPDMVARWPSSSLLSRQSRGRQARRLARFNHPRAVWADTLCRSRIRSQQTYRATFTDGKMAGSEGKRPEHRRSNAIKMTTPDNAPMANLHEAKKELAAARRRA